MKQPIYLLICIALFTNLNGNLTAQAGMTMDLEIVSYCFVDSISPSQQIEFQKIVNLNTKSEYLKTADGTSTYTVVGTVIPCFGLVGMSERRFRSVSNSSNKRKWTLANSDVQDYHDDILLAAIFYEEFVGSGVGPGKKNVTIPLNYPYGNTASEASRFTLDVKAWFECKGIHYVDTSTWALPSTYALSFQLHTVRNNFDINLDKAYYSVNFKKITPTFISKTGANTVVNSINTYEICDVYRKERNGAIYYIVPYYQSAPLYPNDAGFGLLNYRIDDNYQSARGADCDRPASQNCYVAKADSTLCTYFLTIPTKDTITSIWAGGTLITNASYFATVQPDHKQLQDTLQKFLENKNYYGSASVENTKSIGDGWSITVNYTDIPFDSVQTNRKKYYFDVVDCKDYLYFDVTRNELGGIINTIDQYGRNVICPPEASIMIPCDQLQNLGGCRYKGMVGADKYTASATIDIGKYSSVQFYQRTGGGLLNMPTLSGNTTQVTLGTGNMYSFKSEQKCKYLASQKISYTWSSGELIVSYTY